MFVKVKAYRSVQMRLVDLIIDKFSPTRIVLSTLWDLQWWDLFSLHQWDLSYFGNSVRSILSLAIRMEWRGHSILSLSLSRKFIHSPLMGSILFLFTSVKSLRCRIDPLEGEWINCL